MYEVLHINDVSQSSVFIFITKSGDTTKKEEREVLETVSIDVALETKILGEGSNQCSLPTFHK